MAYCWFTYHSDLRDDLGLEVRVADQGADLVDDLLVRQVRFPGGHVEAPAGDPLLPRADGAQQAHPDLAEPSVGVEDPVQDARAMLDVLGQVGLEPDVGGASAGELALQGQAELLDDA